MSENKLDEVVFNQTIKLLIEKTHTINKKFCTGVIQEVFICENFKNADETQNLGSVIDENSQSLNEINSVEFKKISQCSVDSKLCKNVNNLAQNICLSPYIRNLVFILSKYLENYREAKLQTDVNSNLKTDLSEMITQTRNPSILSKNLCECGTWNSVDLDNRNIPWESLKSSQVIISRNLIPKDAIERKFVREIIILDRIANAAIFMYENSTYALTSYCVCYSSVQASRDDFISVKCLDENYRHRERFEEHLRNRLLKWAEQMQKTSFSDPSKTFLQSISGANSKVFQKRAVEALKIDKNAPYMNSLSLIDAQEYHITYNKLKKKYSKPLIEAWTEVTDPLKYIHEDIAIASYLIVLWKQYQNYSKSSRKPSFVDLGCGNGLLVYILSSEGHRGLGIDVRKRKIWDQFPSFVHLQESPITPSNSNLYPNYDWIIGNHSDELTPWIPIIAAKSCINSAESINSIEFSINSADDSSINSSESSGICTDLSLNSIEPPKISTDMRKNSVKSPVISSKAIVNSLECDVISAESSIISANSSINSGESVISSVEFDKNSTESVTSSFECDKNSANSINSVESVISSVEFDKNSVDASIKLTEPSTDSFKSVHVNSSKSTFSTNFFLLPCCAFDFYTKYQRKKAGVSQYQEYLDYIEEVGAQCGFDVRRDRLKIPSTKRICLIGSNRNFEAKNRKEIELNIDRLIKNKSTCKLKVETVINSNDVDNDRFSHSTNLYDTETRSHNLENEIPGNQWSSDFKAREKVERVRNCTKIASKIRDAMVNRIAFHLLSFQNFITIEQEDQEISWNKGGELHLKDAMNLLKNDEIKVLKKECGGLQTLARNHRFLFECQRGVLKIRIPESIEKRKISSENIGRKKCWFYFNHQNGCPLIDCKCTYSHARS